MPVHTADRKQCMDALAAANRSRVDRARSKTDIKAGRASVADILLDPPVCWQNAHVIDLLMVVPRVGRDKAARALNQARVSHTKPVGDLTVRQSKELIFWFGWR